MSVLVLTIGMASFLLIFFYIRYEKGFDQSWAGADRIYRITLNKTLPDGSVSKTATNYSALGWVLPGEIPGVESSTSLWEDKIMAYTTEHFMPDVRFFWGDTSVFTIFNQSFLSGDIQRPFPTIHSMVISESAALQLFGTKDAFGKTFKINEGWEFTVSGVFADFPENSHMRFDIIGTCEQLFYHMRNYDYANSVLRQPTSTASALPTPSTSWLWTNPSAYTYAKLKEGVTLSEATSGFENIYKKYTSHLLSSGQKSEFVMQPVSAIHTGPALEQEWTPTIDSKTIAALWIVAILALLMSWVIFVNFQITQGIERAKEFGMKKVIGARPAELTFQILFHSILINFASLILALSLMFILRKPLSNFLDLKNLLPIDIASLLVFILVFVVGSVLSGLYPAAILVPRNARLLLAKNFVQKNDGFGLRRSLIVFQFAASIGLLIATFAIGRQVSFMKNKDIGLSIQQTAYSYIPLSDLKKPGAAQKLRAFLNEVNLMPEVKSSTLTSSIPGKAINFHSDQIFPVDSPTKAGSNYGLLTVENHFDEVYQPEILAGRLFGEDDRLGGNLLVINREACSQFGFESPADVIGKFINVTVKDYITIDKVVYQVCGVVENFHLESPRKVIEPLLIINEQRWKYDVGYVSVAFGQKADSKSLAALKAEWEKFYPSDPFDFRFTNETYQLQMKADEKLAGLFSGYTGLSVMLAILGLLGLASNASEKRVKEIGIRKINGATVAEILALLNKDFLLWVLAAFVIATPIAYYFINKWLENFAYKTTLSWWIFVLAGVLSLGIALLTVSWQSWRAATRNPVEALRYE
jgi:putative ABC transport system permease protein